MSSPLTFNFGDTSNAAHDLEVLSQHEDAQGLFDRCCKPDVNVSMFIEGIKTLSSVSFTPNMDKQTWNRLKELVKDIKRPDSPMLFNQSFLPGNGKSESFCTSSDGDRIAYLTQAVSGLHEVGKRCALTRNSYLDAKAKGPDLKIPSMLNLIGFKSRETRSIPLALDDESDALGVMRLLALDDSYVYAIQQRNSGNNTLTSISVEENAPRIELTKLSYPGECFHLLPRAKRFCYIDVETSTLKLSKIDGHLIASIPLQLPGGLEIGSLSELWLTADGATGIITVDNEKQGSRYLFALVRFPSVEGAEQATEAQIRWFLRREFLNIDYFRTCRPGPRFEKDGQRLHGEQFYCLASSGQLFCLDPAKVDGTDLSTFDSRLLLESFEPIELGKKHSFAVLSIANDLPLAASQSTESGRVQIWDTARKSRLLELDCPFSLDALHFAYGDRLIVTVKHSSREIAGKVSVTFLDFLLLIGKAPVLFTARDYIHVKPLLAVAPEDPVLKVLESLIKHFAALEMRMPQKEE